MVSVEFLLTSFIVSPGTKLAFSDRRRKASSGGLQGSAYFELDGFLF
jgi:hypothetical protein